ncbi:MAG: phenylalanine--tRNA ligase subunit beta [Helicobacteraceae bacterium]|jgi:phenylalanyl-tRNA synthetase beta chain|nr:phenylalanine--tRNA ligase subunit beta [Helicobacteraceae bacterium]
MIVTRSWLNEFIPLDTLDDKEIVNALVRIGHEVAYTKKFAFDENVVVGNVIECEKHPDADKLSVTKVDVRSEILPVVCGAKNVEAGMFVPVAKIGAKLPGDFVIKEAVLRGVKSRGMICSAAELGLPRLNDGILPLDSSVGTLTPGKKISSYKTLGDTLFEVDLTPNRGDCLSVHGLARDLAAALQLPLNGIKKAAGEENSKGIGRLLRLLSDPNATAEVMVKAMENRGALMLPLIVKLRLALAKIEAEQIIDKLTAYATHSSGVLFRAFDFESFGSGELKLTYQNGLNALLCDEEVERIGIDANGKFLANDQSKIIIFSAFFVPPEEISKTLFDQKLKGDHLFPKAAKGSEPNLAIGINFLSSLLGKNSLFFSESLTGGKEVKRETIEVQNDSISALAGQEIDTNQITLILRRLGCEAISSADQKSLLITPPLFRHDLQNTADLCEEIVRMIGIDSIAVKPSVSISRRVISKGLVGFRAERTFAARAAANGFFESLHFIFCSKESLALFGFEPMANNLAVANPISAQLDSLRPTLLINLLYAAQRNRAKNRLSIALFEIGDVYDSKRTHSREIAFVFSGAAERSNIGNRGKSEDIGFYGFAKKIAGIIGEFELKEGTRKLFLQEGQRAKILQNGNEIGEIGKLSPSVAKALDLDTTYVASFDLARLCTRKYETKPYSKLQSVERDLSIVINKDFTFGDIKNAIKPLKIPELKLIKAIDAYSDESMSGKHSLTLRFTIQPFEQSLTEEEIAAIVERILGSLADRFKAELR